MTIYNFSRCEFMKKVGRENILFFKYRSLEDMGDLKNIKDLLSDNKLVYNYILSK